MFENLHRAPGDAVFAMTVPGQATMYSADLSSSRKVHSVSAISFSGNTSAQWVRGGWNLYRNNGAEPTRTGIGNLRSISDQFVAIQNADGLHIETVDGKSVSVLKVPRESKCETRAQILAEDRLLLDSCSPLRIVDFRGKTILQLRRPKGWTIHSSDFRSANANRLLLNYWSRKVSFLRSAGEIATAVTTLGMGVGDEEDNREEVQVVDTLGGRIRFHLHRSFAMGAEPRFDENAAISPSGELVAIAADGVLSLYQVSSTCNGR